LKSSGAPPGILLDTSFLLPTLGISVSGATEEGIRILSETETELYYSRFSILESLWVATRTVNDSAFYDESLRPGLKSIIESGRYRSVEEDSEIFREAFTLYGLGHKDMIDNILYASAARLGLILLTLDDELRKFVLEKGLKDAFISVEELAILTRQLRAPRGNHSTKFRISHDK
jgi:predicted nucleic acid-binding protein